MNKLKIAPDALSMMDDSDSLKDVEEQFQIFPGSAQVRIND